MVLNLVEYPRIQRTGQTPIVVEMETVEIDKIHVNDRSFCVSYPLEDDLLLTSVAKFGVLVPIGLLRRDEPVIVTGFKRLEAARRLGIRELPYVFLDVSERQALLTAIHDNITRPLNTVEKALCIDKMLAAGFKVEEVYEVMTMLGLPPRENILKAAISAAWAEEQAKSFIVKHQLPLTLVEQLFWFEPEERYSIIRLADAVPRNRKLFQGDAAAHDALEGEAGGRRFPATRRRERCGRDKAEAKEADPSASLRPRRKTRPTAVRMRPSPTYKGAGGPRL